MRVKLKSVKRIMPEVDTRTYNKMFQRFTIDSPALLAVADRVNIDINTMFENNIRKIIRPLITYKFVPR